MLIFKPLAVISTSESEITLPENSVIIDLSKSRRRNFIDKIVKWNISVSSGTGTIQIDNINSTGSIALLTFSKEGTYTIRGTVTDRFNLSDFAEVQVKVNPAIPKTEFGIKLQGSITDQLVALSTFGPSVKWIRNGIILSVYSGAHDIMLDNYLDNGYKVALNLSWDYIRPSPFCTDLVSYEAKLRLFLDVYASRLITTKSFVLCENEPTNKGYFGDSDIHGYVEIFKIFIRVCHEYGVSVSDGGMFIEVLNLMALGAWPTSQQLNIDKTTILLDAIKTLPVDYINFHLGIHDDTLEDGKIKRAVDFAKQWTCKTNAICQEYHYEDCTSGSGIVYKGVSEWFNAAVKILIVFSGNHLEGMPNTGPGSKDDALTIGQNLTSMGVKYKEAIDSFSTN